MLRILNRSLYYILFTCIAIVVFAPILLIFFGSFKNNMEIASTSPYSLPTNFLNLENYKIAINKGHLLRGVQNSFLLVGVSLIGNALLGTSTAYVLNRFQFVGKKIIVALFLFAMIIPTYTTEIARFQLIHKLGIYDTIWAPIIIYIGTDILQIYMYMQFLEKISEQLDESAMLDGASYYRIYRSIIFPLLLPVTATLGILKGVAIMNDIFVQQLYMPSQKLLTIATSLTTYVGQRNSDLASLCAAITIALIPSMLIYIIFYKQIFKGMMDGAVKG
ncbi:carbohydrate ABC transporter permease [Paenibacillus aceris]|uniref:Multiple sugar transport system permease protein n=1 Tax=Paenibacillus aceris TaxID=869555 RepID=A0ABS4HUF7_9BACL|nr:carbohydrate ABC transporter permease [Paenibacillus aceris]MBP1962266.1 multiple sugar transport system permease protein [Paenibacillus aceris]NHW37093.1 carbohydrate ABC transporter permease [Paenibacillus aceris]